MSTSADTAARALLKDQLNRKLELIPSQKYNPLLYKEMCSHSALNPYEINVHVV